MFGQCFTRYICRWHSLGMSYWSVDLLWSPTIQSFIPRGDMFFYLGTVRYFVFLQEWETYSIAFRLYVCTSVLRNNKTDLLQTSIVNKSNCKDYRKQTELWAFIYPWNKCLIVCSTDFMYLGYRPVLSISGCVV